MNRFVQRSTCQHLSDEIIVRISKVKINIQVILMWTAHNKASLLIAANPHLSPCQPNAPTPHRVVAY